MELSRAALARLVDHTLLSPTATLDDVRALLDEATELGTYSICVSPSMLPLPWPRYRSLSTCRPRYVAVRRLLMRQEQARACSK